MSKEGSNLDSRSKSQSPVFLLSRMFSSFSFSKEVADYWRGSRVGGVLEEFYLSPKAKIYKPTAKEIKLGKVGIKRLINNLNVYKIIREELHKESPQISNLNDILKEKIDHEDFKVLQSKTGGRKDIQAFFIYERN